MLTLSRVRVDVEIGHRSQSHLRLNRCVARTPVRSACVVCNRHLQTIIWIVRSTCYPIVIGWQRVRIRGRVLIVGRDLTNIRRALPS